MDDSAVRVEFPVKDFKVIINQPTPGQMLVLMLSREPAEGDTKGMAHMIRRITRVMEELMGQTVWVSVFEEGLITGALQPDDLLSLVRDVLRFDWTIGAVPADIESAAATPEPAPRPGPRVVSGG